VKTGRIYVAAVLFLAGVTLACAPAAAPAPTQAPAKPPAAAPAKPTEAAKPAAPAKPAEAAKPAAPAKPAEAAKPAQPASKSPPTTVAEIAMYDGPDRLQILEEGAKKEGKLNLYTTTIKDALGQPMLDAFAKKYPFIQVNYYRANADELRTRILDESKAGRNTFDLAEMSMGTMTLLLGDDVLVPFKSPMAAQYPEASKDPKGLWVETYSLFMGIGYNTNAISESESPKSFEDLLDPKWKGRMTLPASNLTIDWVGAIMETRGEEYFKQLVAQDFRYREVTSTALVNLIGSGEVVLNPTAQSKDVILNQRKGAPIAWNPTKPIVPNVTSISVSKTAPNPHAAMLWMDFRLSTADGEGARITQDQAYSSPALSEEVKKYDIIRLYQLPNYQEKYATWEGLLKNSIIRGGT
jgi:iron(III) transport system substrate-binding protein